jgi:hypothetical protein
VSVQVQQTESRGDDAKVRMLSIRRRLAATTEQDTTLRVMLVLAHETLRREAALGDALQAGARWSPAPAAAGEARVEDYPGLIAHIHAVLAGKLPPGAKALVVSRGDEALLTSGLLSEHFPQGAGGVYAGHYPADSAAAIAHLEQCRSGGAEFFVLPATGFWWLDYYGALLQHLMACGRVLHHDEHCLVFDLRVQ